MPNYLQFRKNMVDCQIAPIGPVDDMVRDAFLDVPRETFVPLKIQHISYMDDNLPLGGDRYMLRPSMLARMVDALNLTGHEQVLHVACNTGYLSAILSKLAKFVIAIDDDQSLTKQAEVNLSKTSVLNVEVVHVDLKGGCEKYGPYDAIIIEGKTEVLPGEILHQLKDGGRLVTIMPCPGYADEVILYERVGDNYSRLPIINGTAPIISSYAKEQEFRL